MKIFTSKVYAILLLAILFSSAHLTAQTLPGGSYVIPMDNSFQTNAAGNFNLKAYGLIVHLLNNNIKLKWSIKTSKVKDGIDFTAFTEQLLPTTVAGGVSRDFKAGPFVISAADTTGVATLINAFYTSNGLTGNNRPRVYRLTASASNVEFRYDMSNFKPKAQILNDGNNSDIHVDFMTYCSIPTSNYAVGPATNLYTNCVTFASEPHNGTENIPTITAIKSFVLAGGNFLAQCRAVETYENSMVGHFHTNNGIHVTNSNVNSTSTIYPKADLSFSQFEGVYDMNITGSVKNWNLPAGSSFINNEQHHVTGNTSNPVGASVSKLTAINLLGGNVFYLGNHTFPSITELGSINGIRMYMNAFLTPVAINQNCVLGGTLPLKYLSFDAVVNDKVVLLKWLTSQEINHNYFEVERSFDMNNYSKIGVVLDGFLVNGTNKSYQFKDNSAEIKGRPIVYYRLKQFDIDGKFTYSKVLAVRLEPGTNAVMQVSPNPFVENLNVRLTSTESGVAQIRIINTTGQTLLSKQATISKGYNNIQVDGLSGLGAGMYVAQLIMNGTVIDNQRVIKNPF